VSERYICIHGHFYQPPRDNPWLEAVEQQESAYPYHDWNERITAECYAPNGTSRILDGAGRITRIQNNYARMSYNFGPTLLAWMEERAPDAYRAVLEADRESAERFSGHGSALAQSYNHSILPLCNDRDRRTQVVWGVRDYEHRFGRRPEGMWLPETAVDLDTLEELAGEGIAFTVLAPRQADGARAIGSTRWKDVGGERIDPSRAYRVHLPSGRTIAAFFYDGPISRGVAFEKLLARGEDLAGRLAGAFSDRRDWPQLVHIATDGETYGHHHAHGDMALAYALRHIESNGLATLTNYGEFLERHPPTHEARIVENSSWSCVHGVERWRADCGCCSGMHAGWDQGWRAPLREALDWLRDTLAPLFEERGRHFLKHPWEARDAYIGVILDRSRETRDAFLAEHAVRRLSPKEQVWVWKLLEMQRHAMLMYTSCGWFFDELSGIETVQVIQYAGRAIQLAWEVSGQDLEPPFLERLERAKSNLPEHEDGGRIYEKFVKPAMVDLAKVGAHYAVNSLFEEYGEKVGIYGYGVELLASETWEAGRARLRAGRARVTSEVTRESSELMFGVLHQGDQNLSAGVKEDQGDEAYRAMLAECGEAFGRGDFPDLMRRMDAHFGPSTYTLKSLFRDEQRRVMELILEPTLADVEAVYRRVFDDHAPMMRYLGGLGLSQPKAFRITAEFVLNTSLQRAFEEGTLDHERVLSLLEEARRGNIPLDSEGLGYALKRHLERLARRLSDSPDALDLLRELEAAARVQEPIPFEVDLWRTQNAYYRLSRTAYPGQRERAKAGDGPAREWVRLFEALGKKLSVRIG
jgi:alpha-amylase/alpha-mannosidase (GH57 family)